MINNYSKPEMIIHFFENHKSGSYATLFIAKYLLNNFDFSDKRVPKAGLLAQINAEVSSNMSMWFDSKYTQKFARNFNRTKDGKKYLYSYVNNNVNLPVPIKTNKPNIHQYHKYIAPKQQSLNEKVKPTFDINLIKEYIENSNDKNNAIKEIINITMACM
jgi:hypothetical protein